ncbi:MAG: agmatinase [Promethearchaeia archaeon]
MNSTFFDFGDCIDPSTEFVIFGIPWDELSTISLPNSEIGPESIRKVSQNIGFTTELGKDIFKLNVSDIGDIEIEKANLKQNLKEIEAFIQRIYESKKKLIPVMIGGDHFCSYPVVKAIGDRYAQKGKFGALFFDAHLDFYKEWDGKEYSHATVSHNVYELEYINNDNFLLAGCRDIDNIELDNAKQEDICYLPAYKLSELGLREYGTQIINFFTQNDIESLYVSIDVDVVDPSNAPGTGYPIPGGLSYRALWQILRELVKNVNIIGFDLVEVAPNLDHNNLTCNLAAKTIIEFISFISDKL